MNKLLVRSKVTQVVLLITMHTTVWVFEKGGVRLCLQLHDEGPTKNYVQKSIESEMPIKL